MAQLLTLVKGTVLFGLVSVCVLTVVTFTGRYIWLAELLTHFRIHYLGLSIAALVFLLWKGERKQQIFALLVTTLNFFPVAPYLLASQPESPSLEAEASERTFYLYNVQMYNRNYEDLRKSLEQADSDLCLIIEATPNLGDFFKSFETQYPHQILNLKSGSSGFALLSRYPFAQSQVLKHDQIPDMLSIKINFPEQQLTLIAGHPYPPIREDLAQSRNETLALLAQKAAAESGPVLLAGDFNCTPWSPFFRDLIRDSGLRDSMRGYGILGTWPSRLPACLRIPIDHVLYSSEIRPVSRKIALEAGSDHLPTVLYFQIMSREIQR